MKMKVFVDTDIIYDLLAEREPFYQPAAKLFTKADEGKVQIFVSALTIANIHYLLSKHLSESEAKKILRKFRILVQIVALNEKTIDLALNSDFSDFEDAIQYYCSIENDIEVLITRNLRDYKKAQIVTMTAQDFISS